MLPLSSFQYSGPQCMDRGANVTNLLITENVPSIYHSKTQEIGKRQFDFLAVEHRLELDLLPKYHALQFLQI